MHIKKSVKIIVTISLVALLLIFLYFFWFLSAEKQENHVDDVATMVLSLEKISYVDLSKDLIKERNNIFLFLDARRAKKTTLVTKKELLETNFPNDIIKYSPTFIVYDAKTLTVSFQNAVALVSFIYCKGEERTDVLENIKKIDPNSEFLVKNLHKDIMIIVVEL